MVVSRPQDGLQEATSARVVLSAAAVATRGDSKTVLARTTDASSKEDAGAKMVKVQGEAAVVALAGGVMARLVARPLGLARLSRGVVSRAMKIWTTSRAEAVVS